MKAFLLIFFLFLSSVSEAPPRMRTVFLPEITIAGKTYDREIFDTALEMGADSLTAKILVAQARFESGGYKNHLTIFHNNIFSMQHPTRRRTTSIGALATAEGRPNTYASYNSVREAVMDLFFYFKARKINLTQPSINTYVYRIKKKAFFEAELSRYRRGVKKEFNRINV